MRKAGNMNDFKKKEDIDHKENLRLSGREQSMEQVKSYEERYEEPNVNSSFRAEAIDEQCKQGHGLLSSENVIENDNGRNNQSEHQTVERDANAEKMEA